MHEAIIDFEFTGLDGSFVKDNEIVQFKAMNTNTGKCVCQNFNSEKEIGAYGFLIHGVKKYDSEQKFSKEKFYEVLNQIGVNADDCIFYGYGVNQDKLMLKRYLINIGINDIREILQRSQYDKKLATEGSGLEEAYYIVTGKIPASTNHNGVDELYLMKELFDATRKIKLRDILEIMPHGHCAGMPLDQYVDEYRRQSDGYRFNNSDLLSESLTHYINEQEKSLYEEDWGDEEDVGVE